MKKTFRYRTRHLVFLTLLIFQLPQNLSAANWTEAKNEDGITVYTKNSPDTPVKTFKAVVDISTGIENVSGVLENIAGCVEWCDRIITARNLKDLAPGESIFYYELDFPFPFKNRDAVQYRIRTTDPQTGVVTFTLKNRPLYLEQAEGKLRMSIAEGSWSLKPLSNDLTRITYEYLADPAGAIPGWLVNLMVVDGPYKTLQNLRAIVEGES